MRTADINRKTNETDISLKLSLDCKGAVNIDSGVGFLDHMLELFASHASISLDLKCMGDTKVDDHHSTEDIGISLGEAIRACVGDKKGINRYGYFVLPMDETLMLVSLDLSGRAYLNFDVQIPTQKVGTFDTELVEEFFAALSRASGMTLHIKMLAGSNSHHIIEAIFKCFARALAMAVKIDPEKSDVLPSTKGVL